MIVLPRAPRLDAMLHKLRILTLTLAATLTPVACLAQARPAFASESSDRVIVTFKVDASVMRAHALSAGSVASHAGTLAMRASTLGARHGLALQSGIGISDGVQVMRVDGMNARDLAARLAQDPDVEAVEPDRRVRRTAVPNDSLFNSAGGNGPAVGQWYLRAPDATVKSSINAVAAWDITKGNASVVVAIIDTGITQHPDLDSKVVTPNYDFISDGDIRNKGTLGSNLAPIAGANDPGDWVTDAEVNDPTSTFFHCTTPDATGKYTGENSSWHGTQTAGIVGAATDNGLGMAGAGWNVRVLPVRVLGKCFGNTSDILAGMR
jgi:serine protease